MQPPCAAASSSSGLVLPSGSPTRDGREKGSCANAPDSGVERARAAREVPVPADVRGALDVRHQVTAGTTAAEPSG